MEVHAQYQYIDVEAYLMTTTTLSADLEEHMGHKLLIHAEQCPVVCTVCICPWGILIPSHLSAPETGSQVPPRTPWTGWQLRWA